jgi:hypothetical protein
VLQPLAAHVSGPSKADAWRSSPGPPAAAAAVHCGLKGRPCSFLWLQVLRWVPPDVIEARPDLTDTADSEVGVVCNLQRAGREGQVLSVEL